MAHDADWLLICCNVHKQVVFCLFFFSFKNWDRLLMGLQVVCPWVIVQRDAVRGTSPAREAPCQLLHRVVALSCSATPHARHSFLTGWSTGGCAQGYPCGEKSSGTLCWGVGHVIGTHGNANRERDLHKTKDLKDLSTWKTEFSNSLLVLKQTTELLARVAHGSRESSRCYPDS